jgi:subtilisin family serine protease
MNKLISKKNLWIILIAVLISMPIIFAQEQDLIPMQELTTRLDTLPEQPKFQGYIVQFQEEPVLAKKAALEKDIQQRESDLEASSTLYKYTIGLIDRTRIAYSKARKDSRVRSQKDKVIKEHRDALADIESRVPSITGYAVAAQENEKQINEYTDVFNGIALDITSQEAEQLKESPYVKEIYPNYEVNITLMDSVPLINADDVWQLDEDGTNCIATGKECLTGENITIAVIDTGVDYSHPDLGSCSQTEFLAGTCSKVIDGYDFVNNDNDPIDDHGHGTHCAATAAGNGILKGVAPDASIYAYKVLSSGGSGYMSWTISAIERAVDPNNDSNFSDHVDIISMSLGGPGNPDSPVSTAVDNAVDAGAVAVIAAGNSGPGERTIGSPGTARKAITVGASDKSDNIAGFSSRGPVIWTNGTIIKPDIIAPGVNICAAQWNAAFSYADTACNNDNNHVAISGTSMATPHVAGAAALLLQKNPDWTPDEIKNTLMKTSIDLGYSAIEEGSGRLDVQEAISLVAPPTGYFEFGIVSPLGGSFNIYDTFEIKGVFPNDYDTLVVQYASESNPSNWLTNGVTIVGSGDLIAEFDPTVVTESGWYTFEVSATRGSITRTDTTRIYFDRSLKEGWPQKFASYGHLWNSPTVEDVDGDGFEEIIITGKNSDREGVVNIFLKNGSQLTGWPQSVESVLEAGVAIGDINNDGRNEIVGSVTSNTFPKIYVWDDEGNRLWSKTLESTKAPLCVVLGDINNNGYLEIITQTLNSKMYVLDYNGYIVDGWPQSLDEYDIWSTYKCPAVADLDGDGYEEIIKNIITNVRYEQGDLYRTMNGTLKVFNYDGTVKWEKSWPDEEIDHLYYADFPSASPLVGDINNDGVLEIITRVKIFRANSLSDTVYHTKFYAFDSRGNLLPGWPTQVSIGSNSRTGIALSDINNDDYLELVASAGNYLYVFEHDGSLAFDPIYLSESSLGHRSNPAIGDLNNDGKSEIIIHSGSFWVIDDQGNFDINLISFDIENKINSNAPVLTDLDKNGKVDLVYFDTSNRKLYVWELNADYNQLTMDWPMFQHDPQHTGLYTKPAFCGDNICQAGENYTNCPEDCPVPRLIVQTTQGNYTVLGSLTEEMKQHAEKRVRATGHDRTIPQELRIDVLNYEILMLDLIVQDISLNSTKLYPNQDYSYKIIVKNQGTVPTTEGLTLDFYISNESDYNKAKLNNIHSVGYSDAKRLQQQESYSLIGAQHYKINFPEPGTYYLHAFVDDEGYINESDETNNMFIKEIKVYAKCGNQICESGETAENCPEDCIFAKDMTKYSSKEAFLISDKDWHDVLPLVPLTTWTNASGNIIKYPTLIYHEEDTGFDVDSIIYFMQQYSPDRVTIIGTTPIELDNLLTAAQELGAGLNSNQIQRITTNDYFSYWQNYKDVVYVEDDYKLSLLASTYASLINAPLVIQRTSSDTANIFINKNIICVGSVSPSGSSCTEQYTLEQLQQKYVDETNTDKIILVNPDDLNIKVIESFQPEKSSDDVNELYSKTSLAAPILASAKHELIISTNETSYVNVDEKFTNSLLNLLNLTPEDFKTVECMSSDECNSIKDTVEIDVLRTVDEEATLIFKNVSIGSYTYIDNIYLNSEECDDILSKELYYKLNAYRHHRGIVTHSVNHVLSLSRITIYDNNFQNFNGDLTVKVRVPGCKLYFINDSKNKPLLEGGYKSETIVGVEKIDYILEGVKNNGKTIFSFENLNPNIKYKVITSAEEAKVTLPDGTVECFGLGACALIKINNELADDFYGKDNIEIEVIPEKGFTNDYDIIPIRWVKLYPQLYKDHYLTIFGSHDALQMSLQTSLPNWNYQVDTYYATLNDEFDHNKRKKINEYYYRLLTGRIFGISLSDVSSYTARIIFYEGLNKNDYAAIVSRGTMPEDTPEQLKGWINQYSEGNSDNFMDLFNISFECYSYNDPIVGCDSKKNEMIQELEHDYIYVYDNHGWYDWIFLSTGDLSNKYMNPGITFLSACATCSYLTAKDSRRSGDLMCAQLLRRGKLGIIGAQSIAWIVVGGVTGNFMKSYINEDSMGDIWNTQQEWGWNPYFILLGDPTFEYGTE